MNDFGVFRRNLFSRALFLSPGWVSGVREREMRVMGRLRIVDLLGGGHTWAGLCPRASRER